MPHNMFYMGLFDDTKLPLFCTRNLDNYYWAFGLKEMGERGQQAPKVWPDHLNVLCTLLCRLVLLFLDDTNLQTLLSRSEFLYVIELLSPEPKILLLPSNAFPAHKLTRRWCASLSLWSNSREMAELLTSLHDLLPFHLSCSSNNLSAIVHHSVS